MRTLRTNSVATKTTFWNDTHLPPTHQAPPTPTIPSLPKPTLKIIPSKLPAKYSPNTHPNIPTHNDPPLPPSLLPPRNQAPTFISEHQDTVKKFEIKLSIDFPLRSGTKENDISLFFKRFCTVLFSADKNIQLLKWEQSTSNPIANASDIAYDEKTIGEYYSGMKFKNNRRRIIGYSKIISPIPFYKIKKHQHFYNWLTTNNVWVRTTSLSSNNHVKLGWILNAHPSFTHQKYAINELKKRMENLDIEIEISPHTISHTTSDNKQIRTNTLRIDSTADHSHKAMDLLIKALTNTPSEHSTSPTQAYKIIPFQNHGLSTDEITELIYRQNKFLHETSAISIINAGDGDAILDDGNDTHIQGSLRSLIMNAQSPSDDYLFSSVFLYNVHFITFM